MKDFHKTNTHLTKKIIISLRHFVEQVMGLADLLAYLSLLFQLIHAQDEI